MKRLNAILAVPLVAGLFIVSGCSNDDEPGPQPTNTVVSSTSTPTQAGGATATRTSPPVNTATNTPNVAPPTATNTPNVAPPTATNTPEVQSTATNTPEVESTATNTPDVESTATNTPEVQSTATNTPEEQPPTPTSTPEVTNTPSGDLKCGDETTTPPEECDDGNNYGGDGCAANCTFEKDLTLNFGTNATTESLATVQTGLFSLGLKISGKQIQTMGAPREDASVGADGFTNFAPGQVPLATVINKNEQDGIAFIDPINVPGLVCACLRGIELQSCGGRPVLPGGDLTPDNGVVCNGNPDLCNGNPAGPCKPAFGPGVNAAGRLGCAGISTLDYLVITDSLSMETYFTPSGDPLTEGAYNTSYTAIGTIMDTTGCAVDKANAGKGPDGIPCTADDPASSRGTANLQVQTTGSTTANVLNVNNQPGVNIDADSTCGASQCIVSSSGTMKSCAELLAGNTGGLCLAAAFASLDQPTTGDIAVPSVFCGLAE